MNIPYYDTIFEGSVTGDGDTFTTPSITRHVKEAAFFVDITALGAGTELTLDLKTYNSVGDKWHRLAMWVPFTATGVDAGYVAYGLGDRVAIEYSLSGGVTTATFSVSAHYKEF